ncbi:hypothetical protein CRG98_013458, partial [Punica granatum]
MAKSPAHISLLTLLLSSEPHREALLRVLTAAQVPKGTSPDRMEETINSIFSNTISFSDNELPSEGCAHSRALHIVCKCNNHIVSRVMIDNGSALNVCPVTTLKHMNIDLNRVRSSKTAVRAFDGSQREVRTRVYGPVWCMKVRTRVYGPVCCMKVRTRVYGPVWCDKGKNTGLWPRVVHESQNTGLWARVVRE